MRRVREDGRDARSDALVEFGGDRCDSGRRAVGVLEELELGTLHVELEDVDAAELGEQLLDRQQQPPSRPCSWPGRPGCPIPRSRVGERQRLVSPPQSCTARDDVRERADVSVPASRGFAGRARSRVTVAPGNNAEMTTIERPMFDARVDRITRERSRIRRVVCFITKTWWKTLGSVEPARRTTVRSVLELQGEERSGSRIGSKQSHAAQRSEAPAVSSPRPAQVGARLRECATRVRGGRLHGRVPRQKSLPEEPRRDKAGVPAGAELRRRSTCCVGSTTRCVRTSALAGSWPSRRARKPLEPGRERLEGGGGVGGAEDARAGDEELGAGGAGLVDRLERDAAVDLEHDLGRQQRRAARASRSVEVGM